MTDYYEVWTIYILRSYIYITVIYARPKIEDFEFDCRCICNVQTSRGCSTVLIIFDYFGH